MKISPGASASNRSPRSALPNTAPSKVDNTMYRPKQHRLSPRTMFADLPAPPLLQNPPPILSLPIEILLEIKDHLEADAQTLLTLTCKTLLHRIGCASWEHPALAGQWHGDAYHSRWDAPRPIPSWMLTPETLIRVPFLQALARDTPTLTYCNDCRTLHPNLPRPTEVRLRKKDPGSGCLARKGVVDWTTRDERQWYILVWHHIAKAMTVHAEWLKDPSYPANHVLLSAQ